MTDYLASPLANHDITMYPASPATAAPPSPALNREQIKNRSTRGWSGSNSTNGNGNGSSMIPPLNFRSKPSSAGMMLNPSTDSAISSIDSGSPFGSILSKFDNPPQENTRKSSGSFKVLEKKAVSNSPFLTGGNTTTSSPAATTNARKPFSPSNFGAWNGASNSAHNSPSSSPAGKHGLGLFARSTPASQSPVQPVNTVQASAFTSSRIPHRRTNSDVENQNPNRQEELRDVDYLSVEKIIEFQAPSPATQFNAEMEAIGGPQAIDVTYSGSESSPELDQQPVKRQQQKRGPRPSVAALGNRGSVSSSPFLQQGLPQPPLPSNGHRQTSSISSLTGEPTTTSSALSSGRKGMGPREPSYSDLRAQAGSNDDDDMTLPRLTQATLERKASKKSVKWAEVEEVCEFDVLTEDGGSRRSSAASSNADDYYSNYVGSYASDSEETEDEGTPNVYAQQQFNDLHNGVGEDEHYDNYRHSSLEPQEQEDQTIHPHERSTTPTLGDEHVVDSGPGLRRDASVVSQHATFVDNEEGQPGDSSASSYQEEDNEVQRLIDEVSAASLQGRQNMQSHNDVFTDGASGEFGVRTPHSSAGSYAGANNTNVSMYSNQSIPQPLNFNGSLSRRPLPSPPVGLSIQPASPESVLSYDDAGAATADSSMFIRAEDSAFSLPDLGLSDSPLLSFDELGLARKESLKRAYPKVVSKKSASPSMLSQEILRDQSGQHDKEDALAVDRSVSPRPQITMEEVRDSLRKRPNSLFANFAPSRAPLCSTPPSGNSVTSKSNLPTPSGSSARAGPSKAISARPAPPPVRISSEQLPTARSATPAPASPTKEPESALDRLVRETTNSSNNASGGLLQAPNMGRGRSNSSSSSTSGHSFHSADSQHSDGKEALRRRDEALLAAKRKKKGLSVDSADSGRPKGRRRSLSTGDADMETIKPVEAEKVIRSPTPPEPRAAQRPKTASTLGPSAMLDEPAFGQSLGQALDNVVDYHERGYRVRENQKGSIAYLGAGGSKISTVGDAGDIDAGGAWKKVRRPSDIHEHRTRIKEYKQTSASRSRETGAIFVKVGKLMLNQRFPVPKEATYVICELNNGLEHVATGATRLTKDTNISQEFELIAHPGLEINLTFKIRKDPRLDKHLFPQAQPTMSMQSATPPSPSKHSHSGSASGGFRNGLRNLLSSPKKNRAARPQSAMEIHPTSVAMVQQPTQPILDYLSRDGEICKVSVTTDTLLKQCTGKKLKIAAACTQARDARRSMPEIAELEITLFHIPALPGVPVSSLPQNIEECLIGLEQARRYEEIAWEGVLTQQGADCSTWRRRLMRLKGSRLLAFNEITHNAHAVLYLHTALALEDPEEDEPSTPANTAMTPSTATATPLTGRNSRASGHRRALSIEDDEDPFSTRPNSFRIIFDNEIIVDFFADTAEEKAKWMQYLRPIIRGGKKENKLNESPPLWAQTLRAHRKEHKTEQSSKTA